MLKKNCSPWGWDSSGGAHCWVCRQILRWSKLFPPWWCQMLLVTGSPPMAAVPELGYPDRDQGSCRIWGKMMAPAAGLPQEHPRHNECPSLPLTHLNPWHAPVFPTRPPQVPRVHPQGPALPLCSPTSPSSQSSGKGSSPPPGQQAVLPAPSTPGLGLWVPSSSVGVQPPPLPHS